MYATCSTEGCFNYLEPVVVVAELPVACGPCGQEVANITDIKPTEGTVLPQWILDQLAMQNSDN